MVTQANGYKLQPISLGLKYSWSYTYVNISFPKSRLLFWAESPWLVFQVWNSVQLKRNYQFLFSIFGVTIESYKEKFIPGFQNLDYCSDLSHHVWRGKIFLVWSGIVKITSPGLHAFCSHFRFFIPFAKIILFCKT